jgi:4-amino-4-deoxy-L-arabinose transferase-like glycosyltransferase
MALELAVSARYGFHRDELYFIASGRHPAFGYVDQPPLAPLVARCSTDLFGVSPTAVRVAPAIATGAIVVGTGLTARTLGGGRFAQLLAALAIASSPIVLGSAHLAGTTVYDLAAWTFAIWFTCQAVLRGRPRAWLAAGAVAGVGLENKDLLLLFGVALVIGLFVTPARSLLRTRWPWLGALVAFALWIPNLVWQIVNGFPSLAMDHVLHSEHSAMGDYVGFLPAQVIMIGILAFPIVVIGVRHLMTHRDLHFALVLVAIVVMWVFVVIPGRAYYTAGVLPLLFAAGARRIEHGHTDVRRRRVWLVAPVVGAVLTVGFVLPVLPLSVFAQMTFLHTTSYDLGETVGWPQFTAQVARAYDALPAPERNEAAIFTRNYGEAGALEIFGRDYGLPEPLSGHNNYWLWGPGGSGDRAVLAVGALSQLRPHFAECRSSGTIHSPDGVDNDENGTGIWICTRPRGAWTTFWSSLRNYG